jgi:hypothetical protein
VGVAGRGDRGQEEAEKVTRKPEEVPDAMDNLIEALVAGMAEGKVELVSIRANVCGKCKEGTMVGSPTPNWMNRAICDRCGRKASR